MYDEVSCTVRLRPNVLFLFTDDQRHDTLGALGNDMIQTPNLDRLAARGATFTRAHIPSGTSAAVCMPSRAMLHTGRSLFRIHDAGQTIPTEHVTIGETLRAQGYRTFGCGKWHNGRDSFHRSFSEGDEIFFGGMSDHWNVPLYHYDPSGKYDATLPEIREPQRTNDVRHRPCDHIHAGKHSSELLSDAAVHFLDTYDGEEPFFLYVSYLAPHDPRSMPSEYLNLYDPDTIPLPPNFMGGHPFDNGELRVRDELLSGFPRTPAQTRRHIAEYYATITHLDAEIGRVLDTLERRGLADDTLVILAGDNGLALGEHGLFGKQNCYEHSLRVPLIFAGPNIPQGVRRDAYVYLFDIFPTLCELVGVQTPMSVDGVSLTEVLADPNARVRETLYFAYCEFQRAVKDERYKLIEYIVNEEHTMTQLFDVEADPRERVNLAHDPTHAERLQLLRTELSRCSHDWGDRASRWGEAFWSVYDRATSS